jgi:hypothetical protein
MVGGFWVVKRIYWTITFVTTNDYQSLAQLHTPNITVTLTQIKSSQSSLTVVCQRLPTEDVTRPLGSQCQSQSYFTAFGLPPISVYLRQAPWGSRPEIFLQLNTCGHSSYVTSCLARRWVCLLWICLTFVKCTYRTYNLLLKILPFALHISTLSIQALQSRSCLS